MLLDLLINSLEIAYLFLLASFFFFIHFCDISIFFVLFCNISKSKKIHLNLENAQTQRDASRKFPNSSFHPGSFENEWWVAILLVKLFLSGIDSLNHFLLHLSSSQSPLRTFTITITIDAILSISFAKLSWKRYISRLFFKHSFFSSTSRPTAYLHG